MKHQKIIPYLVLSLLWCAFTHAQAAIIPTGNEAIDTGGTASYTIGQVAY